MSNFYLWHMGIFSFFVEFLGCILVRNCVWIILRYFCGLKEGFYGEVKCAFLGFLIETESMEECLSFF